MNKVVGTSVSRKDGLAKVLGTAHYSAEHPISGIVHGYLVTSTIAKGHIRGMNTAKAEQSPGVLAVFTHENAPEIHPPDNNFINSKIYESRLPLADNQIHYAGQIIGLVVAETFEQAREAVQLITVDYEVEPPVIDGQETTYETAMSMFGEAMTFTKGEFATGNFEAGTAEAATHVEATYTTSTELHAPMEPHAIIAHWQDADSLTVYEPSQFVKGSQRTYGQLFNLPSENVRIVTPYIGGAFGSKAFPWSHGILCAAAARALDRPLKLAVTRRQMTANTGHRSETEQTLRLAATKEGKLLGISQNARSCTSPVEVFPEPCTSVTPVMYAAPNLQLNQEVGVLNVGVPTFMRAPGEAPGMWGLESAMDELASTLEIDPVELRLQNETTTHQRTGLPFSAKHFRDCLQVGADRFGWNQRSPQPRSQTRDGKLVGWGMAAAAFPALRGMGTSVTVQLFPNGKVHVLTAGNDIGTGAYTMVAMTAAEALGVSVDQVTVELGDSNFPDGGMAGGSMMTASLAPSVFKASQAVLQVANCQSVAEACTALKQSGESHFEATASTAPGQEGQQWAFHSWGAHFCEVTVDEEIGQVQITRWVSVMNIGQVLNAKAAASQIRGGVIMGIGEALMEACHFDPNTAYPVVYDLATYHYPSHADIPRIDVTFVGEPDYNFNSLGVRGVGEIGITGVAPTVANAIYHATGKRLRSLPLTPDQLLA
ncbi:xanthine dehydrogenase, molybdenum binding subunit apoprotein [Halothece sp. PCC 7418]|uniref:xanthine dehydrogenase family protein molybdopterin-binding subunit n=1 Tax=Halothece sp. (strain PCC 7418) TaxID=65093 RepID=UPI0002A077EB|nr:xanthine dehydrogenase family protein molybdopterin-binding subunit [Halothece sp. PCC 7418]AFZ44541.1 xanthine dehydrogenase, molybdenum binding subunit apoprotein [Halothece sp. PCC 7418]